MSAFTRDELVARIVRAGELEVSGEHPDEVEAYFDTENFRFHGPDGAEADYAGLSAYFASMRSAFDDRSIRRGIVVVDGDVVACQTWIEGTFVRPFTHSPVGELPPPRRTRRHGPDQHLPSRRPGPACRGIRSHRQPQHPAPARCHASLTAT